MNNIKISNEALNQAIVASQQTMAQQDIIWSTYSNDKIDIGEKTAKVLTQIIKNIPDNKELRIISIGCGIEPQFNLLQSFANGGLYLIDNDQTIIDKLKNKVKRQKIKNVYPIKFDMNNFTSLEKVIEFFNTNIKTKVHAIFFHHSLYYVLQKKWQVLIENIYSKYLLPGGIIHAVLMSSECAKQNSTTWIYNTYAGKFFGHKNEQDLKEFAEQIKGNKDILGEINCTSSLVEFSSKEFYNLMAVIWMIMLHPHVHNLSEIQLKEITEFIYISIFKKEQLLIQIQDHLFIQKNT